jgi:streptomycin 6-kinase
MTRQKDQKLADTRERLDQETKRVQVLEQEKLKSCETIEAQEHKIVAMEKLVEELQKEVDEQRGMKDEIAELRMRLDKEVAFVQILERDTQQMADELVKLSRCHQELMEQHDQDTSSYRSQCTELRQQLASKVWIDSMGVFLFL